MKIKMFENHDIDPELLDQLKQIKEVPERDPQKAAAGRLAFQKRAAILTQGVSPRVESRHKDQRVANRFSLWQQKENKPMLSTFGTILLIFSMLLGGSGVTVAAAQSSLPEQSLYNVKLLSEQVWTNLQTTPESEFDLALALEGRRASEIEQLLESGVAPTEEVLTRFQAQIDEAIRLALNLSQDQAALAFQQMKVQLQTQDQAMQQIRLNSNANTQAVLFQAQEMMQNRLQVVANGEALYQQNQNQFQNQNGSAWPTDQNDESATDSMTADGSGNPWTTGTPTPLSGYGSGNGDGNPWTTGTPTPYSGYGEGNGGNPWTTGTPTPYSGYGDGNGGNPWTTGTPTPYSGYGDGNGDNVGGNTGGNTNGNH